MNQHLCSTSAALLFLGAIGGCAAPIDKAVPVSSMAAVPVDVRTTDLRAAEWKVTKVVQNTTGVVQHVGDDKLPGGRLPDYLVQRLSSALASVKAQAVAIKTTDIRLSIPGAKVDQAQLASAVATAGLIAAPMQGLLSTTSRNKAASAVFCISVDGRDYLGNDARLFRFGPEGELRDSIEAAIAVLGKNIAGGVTTSSEACQPGWEGGQPRP